MATMDWKQSLERLVEMVPPPKKPLETKLPIPKFAFADGSALEFPPDYLALTEAYGSGEFGAIDGDFGMIASIHNPRAKHYEWNITDSHKFLSEFKESEGDGYADYEIFPNSPGLLLWGWCEGRKDYFWLTKGAPEKWSLIIMWDFKFFGKYNMPLVVFLERLFSGKIDARFLEDESKPTKIDPKNVRFLPRETNRM